MSNGDLFPIAGADNSCTSLDVSEDAPATRYENCDREYPAICYRPNNLTFPQMTEFVQITPEKDGILFERSSKVVGWKVDYKVDMWPSNSLNRKYDFDKMKRLGKSQD